MKLGFILPLYPSIGGTETVTHLLIDYFDNNGIESNIISCCSGTSIPTKCKTCYLQDIDINSADNDILMAQIAKNYSFLINQGPFWHIGSTINTNESGKIISVLHYSPTFQIENNLNAIIEKFRKQTGSITYFIKTLVRYIFKNYFAFRDFYREDLHRIRNIVEQSDAFVVLCDAYIQEFVDLYGIKDKTHIYAIPNPIKICEKVTDKHARDRKHIIFVGRLTAWDKRVDRLLRIWSKLFKDFQDWELDILGDGPEKDNLMIMARNMGLERIIFHGFCNPDDFYDKSSILCLTSSSEGLPMVIIEAACHKCMSIAYSVSSGVKSLIRDEETGRLISPFKERDYVNALKTLMRDDVMREQYCNKAQQFAQDYDLRSVGPLWMKLFEELS